MFVKGLGRTVSCGGVCGCGCGGGGGGGGGDYTYVSLPLLPRLRYCNVSLLNIRKLQFLLQYR